MTSELQKEETPIDQEIVNELIALTPQTWNAIVLKVVYSTDESGTSSYDHLISSPEEHKDIVTASERIFDATFRLGSLFGRHGRHWRTATYRAQLTDEGSWEYQVNFTY